MEHLQSFTYPQMEWLRGKCRLEDGNAILDIPDAAELTKHTYLAMPHDDLFWKLAKLKVPDEIPGFVEQYGLLSSGRVVRTLEHMNGICVNSRTDENGNLVEPIAHWEKIVGDLNMAIGLYSTLRKANSGDVSACNKLKNCRAVFENYMDKVKSGQGNFEIGETKELLLPLLLTYHDANRIVGKSATDNDIQFFSRFVAFMVNNGLMGMQGDAYHGGAQVRVVSRSQIIDTMSKDQNQKFVQEMNGLFSSCPYIPSLDVLAYHQLSVFITCHYESRICERCGSVYPVRDQRNKYCGKRCSSAMSSKASYHNSTEQGAKRRSAAATKRKIRAAALKGSSPA